jgi:hypothetical protein
MSPIDEAVSWYTALPAEQKRTLAALVCAMAALRTVGLTNALVLAGVSFYLSSRLPAKATFLPWFERWFKREYFPKLVDKLQHELAQRAARRRSLFDSLSDKVHAWVVGSTSGLQASFVYELLDKRVMFSDFYVCRFASINIGSRDRPMPVAFVGVHDGWYLAPWHRLDFDNLSLLEQIEAPSGAR